MHACISRWKERDDMNDLVSDIEHIVTFFTKVLENRAIIKFRLMEMFFGMRYHEEKAEK